MVAGEPNPPPIRLGRRRYRASLAKIAPERQRDEALASGKCMLAISLGAEKSEGARLEACVEWIKANGFRHCLVLVADSIYRLTLQVRQGLITPAASRSAALQAGRAFVETYQPLFANADGQCRFEFKLFSEIEASPEFEPTFNEFVRLFETNPRFQESIREFSHLYLGRKEPAGVEPIEVSWLKERLATLYLLEEAAIFSLLKQAGWGILVYAGSIKTFLDIAEGKISGVPEHLADLVFVSLRLNRGGTYYDDQAFKQVRRYVIEGNGSQAAWSLPVEELAILKGYATPVSFQPRQILVEYGRAESDYALYLLEQGEVEVALPGDGVKQELGLLQAGAVFGEQSFFDGQPRTAEVIARTAGRALALSRSAFEQLQQGHPQLACAWLLYVGDIQSRRKRLHTEAERQQLYLPEAEADE
jgi:tRNA-dependent cyclodipeptide synthase